MSSAVRDQQRALDALNVIKRRASGKPDVSADASTASYAKRLLLGRNRWAS